jgi:hypothetical protein
MEKILISSALKRSRWKKAERSKVSSLRNRTARLVTEIWEAEMVLKEADFGLESCNVGKIEMDATIRCGEKKVTVTPSILL